MLAIFVASMALSACGQEPAPTSGDHAATLRARSTIAIEEADIATLQAQMASGAFTSRALTQAYLERIAAIDDAGPMLNAVIEINPAALREAEARDAERAAGDVKGPLHGVPVLVKDNIDATPMVNSAGSLALREHRPSTDAFLVAQLRKSGAVILGKTNLSEWANFRSTHSTSGWSARGGQTKNPYALDRNPCGSSSGSGAAVAASLAAVAVGTETNGSIICPAAVMGLVGVKPTVGLVSRSGVIPISRSQDTAGPMARSVADAAILLSAMVGADRADPATAAASTEAADYHAALNKNALHGARIGVLRQSMGFHPEVDRAFEAALEVMRAAGAELVDADITTAGQWRDAQREVLLYEFKTGVEEYLRASGAPVRSLAELIEFNKANAAAEMPHFAQELFDQAAAKGSLEDASYRQARETARRLAREEGVDAALKRGRLDALAAPASGPAWLTDPILGDHFLGAGYGAAAVAGTPSVTVPMGQTQRLPLGLVLMGAAWSEARLLALAYSYEHAARSRVPPLFAESVARDH